MVSIVVWQASSAAIANSTATTISGFSCTTEAIALWHVIWKDVTLLGQIMGICALDVRASPALCCV